MVPFNVRQFFDVFSAYNLAVWPMQIALVAAALAVVLLAARPTRAVGRISLLILAGLWVWMGAVYHLGFFSRINPAARAFGVAFLVQGGLFLAAALRGGFGCRIRRNAYGYTGMALVTYALALYPVLGLLAGHVYPASPTFGAPCPTTIFTFGVLLWAERRVPGWLLVLPLAWSLIGVPAALGLGVFEDLGLIVAGVLATTMILVRNRRLAGVGRIPGELQVAPASGAAGSVRES